MVKTGLDILVEEKLAELGSAGVGLVANHASVDRSLEHISDILNANGVRLRAVFGPEHGARGSIAEGSEVTDYLDPKLGVPVYSLYGKHQAPTREMLKGIDIVIIDLQDVGSRFYTYLYTMSAVMDACKECGIAVWILDRPNPIAGIASEGFVLESEYASFVGKYPIAQRHALTIGELSLLFHRSFGVGDEPVVIGMQGWKRDMWFEETGLPWVLPSPNMPTVETALLYSGTCLLEGTNLSEGRGTARPFEIIGAPWIDPSELKSVIKEYNLPGVAYREAYFVPRYSKYSGENCSGIQLYVTDRSMFQPVTTAVAVLCGVKGLYPDQFRIDTAVGRKCHFDLLSGASRMREFVEAGKGPWEIASFWQEELARYANLIDTVKLY